MTDHEKSTDKIHPGKPTKPESSAPAQIAVSTLIYYVLIFILGGVAVFIFQKIPGNEQINFGATGLITFIFGIALSSASIMLAIAAISLGKSSERAMIERSDHSIKLQNEVFVKTTEALGRIESSTGITEKRIEDIIAGRAGDLSRAIAENITDDSTSKPKDREKMEEEIKNSILSSLNEQQNKTRDIARFEARKEAELAQKTYAEFIKKTLLFIANTGKVKSEKIGDGNATASGVELFDGIFNKDGYKIGVSVYTQNSKMIKHHISTFQDFIGNCASELANSSIHFVFIIFDSPVDGESEYRKIYLKLSAIISQDVFKKIKFIDDNEPNLELKIQTELDSIGA